MSSSTTPSRSASVAATPARGDTHHEMPPAVAADLKKFPVRPATGVWFRAHVDHGTDPANRGDRDRGCWWFSSVTGEPAKAGRFDLPPDRGTCYLGATDEIAARERVGTQLRKVRGGESVSVTALDTPEGPVIVTEVTVNVTRAANLPVKAAQKWVNRSLWSGTGIYHVAQAWAAAFDRARFGGLLYEPRFTGGARARALAVFGPGGRPKPTRHISTSQPLAEVLKACGVRIVYPPATPPAVLAGTTAPPAL